MEATQPPTLEPTDLAWAAGILDGEGCFSLARLRQPQNSGRFTYHVHVVVANTDLRILGRLAELFGGRIYPARHKNERRRPIWHWKVQFRTAQRVIALVHPYLVGKRDQADLLLTFEPTVLGQRTSPAELEHREGIRRELTLLKGRKAA